MSQKKTPLIGHGYLIPYILITLLFFMWGFARNILDVLNNYFRGLCDLTNMEASAIQVITYLCYCIMAIPAGIFISKYGYRKGVVAGLLLFAVGAIVFVPINNYVGPANPSFFGYCLVALAIIGTGLTFLETSANPYSTELGPRQTATSRLNLSQSFNGLGGILGPLVIGNYLNMGGSLTLPYTVIGGIVIVVAIIFTRVNLPEITHEDEATPSNAATSEGASQNAYKMLLSNKGFMLGLVALLAYEVAEISINSFFITFTTEKLWFTKELATNILALALAFFMIGRFIGGWLMVRIRPITVMTCCALGSVICMGIVVADIEPIAKYALVLNYVFESIMFPTIFSLALGCISTENSADSVRLTKAGSSMLMMTPIGGCGFMLMAWVADTTKMADGTVSSIPYLIPLVCMCLVLLFCLKTRKAA